MQEQSSFMPPWNALSVPGLVRSSGQFRAGDIVIREMGDTVSTLGRAPRSLTAGELWLESERLARQLTTLGAKAGDRIAVNCLMSAELMVAITGIMMAGAMPLVLPVTLSSADKKAAIDAAHVSGLICGVDGDDLLLAISTRQLAIETFAIRFVASFGLELPDGVVTLQNWRDEDLASLSPDVDPLSTSLLTIDPGDPTAVHERTQIQLIAEALAFAATTQLRARDTILQTLAAGSSHAMITSLVVPLLVKAQACLLPVFAASQFSAMVRSAPASSALVVPAHLEGFLSDADRAFDGHVASVVFVHQAGSHTRHATTIRLRQCRIVDATLIGEVATLVMPRTMQGRRMALPTNWQQPGTRVRADTLPLVTAEISNTATVHLSGYGVAQRLGDRSDAVMVVGRKARVDGDSYEFDMVKGAAAAAA
jgi:mycobactin salicyl-AMP ligase